MAQDGQQQQQQQQQQQGYGNDAAAARGDGDAAAGGGVSRSWSGVVGMLNKVRVHLALILVQLGFAGFQLLTKLAFDDGLNKSVYPVYRNILACLLLLPLAALYERKERPSLTFSHLLHFFFLGVAAVALGQGLYLYGLDATSPTFASAFQNSIPAMTFVIAAVSRVEDVSLYRRDGQLKLLGAIGTGLGATVMSVYKGPLIFNNVSPAVHPAPRPILLEQQLQKGVAQHLGAFYLAVSCIGFAVYYVLQAKTLKLYPARVSTVFFTNLFGAIQLAVFNLATQPSISAWKLVGRYQLLAVFYAGFIASGAVFSLQAWCMQQAGPVVVSAYQPLQTLAVGIISFLFMAEAFYSGSIIGAVLIILGLYLVIWGQEKHKEHLISRQSSMSGNNYVNDDQASKVIEEGLLTERLLNSK